MNIKDMQAIKDREEQLNTQYAIKNNEDARVASSVLGDEVLPCDSDSSVPSDLQDHIHQEAIQKRAETLYEMVMRFLKQYILRYENSIANKEKEKYYHKFSKSEENHPHSIEYLGNKKIKVSTFYNEADIKPSAWSDIKAGTTRIKQPKEETIFKLILGLHLNKTDACALLSKATHDLVKDFNSSPYHQAILYCIEHEIYQKEDAHKVLEDKRLEVVNGIIDRVKKEINDEGNILAAKEEIERESSIKEKLKTANRIFNDLLYYMPDPHDAGDKQTTSIPYTPHDYFHNPYDTKEKLLTSADDSMEEPHSQGEKYADFQDKLSKLKAQFFFKLSLEYNPGSDSDSKDAIGSKQDASPVHDSDVIKFRNKGSCFQKQCSSLKNEKEAEKLAIDIKENLESILSRQSFIYDTTPPSFIKQFRKYVYLDRLAENYNKLLRMLKSKFHVKIEERTHQFDE